VRSMPDNIFVDAEKELLEQSDDYIELEKCPFCGSPATIVRHPGIWDNPAKGVNNGRLHSTWYVGCPSGFFEAVDGIPDCKVHPSASWYAHLADAVKDWNKRVKGEENA